MESMGLSSPPSAAVFASRFQAPRTLRTRATGIPFRVVWRGDELVVIPSSGIERRVSTAELRRAWPLIAAGATRTALKLVSNNSSYLDAIFDDLQDTKRVPGADPKPVPPSASAEQLDGAAVGLLRTAQKEIAELRGQLSGGQDARREIAELRVQLRRAQDAGPEIAKLRRDLRSAQDEISRLERAARIDNTDALEFTITRLRRDLLEAKTALLHTEKELVHAHDRVAAAGAKASPETGQLVLKIGEHTFDSKHEIRPDLWEILHGAGQLSFKFPSESVAASRRALESALGYLWRQATGGVGTPKVADMLSDLHGHRLMPIPDWHLAKNIYGRAGAIVHEGTKRPDQALWIFFGALQICELVQADEKAM